MTPPLIFATTSLEIFVAKLERNEGCTASLYLTTAGDILYVLTPPKQPA